MRNVDEYVQNYVPKSVQLQAYEIEKELRNLLKALDGKGLIRTSLRGTSKEKLETYWWSGRNADRILASVNKFQDMYLNEKKREKFFELTRESGFTDEDLAHLLHVQLMFTFLLDIETFKNFLLLILKNDRTKTLGGLFGKKGKLVTETKENGEAQKISDRLDIDLRNELAHFTFWEEGASIHYYEYRERDHELILNKKEIKSADLLGKTIEQSLIRAILACVIADWYSL